MGKIVLEIEEFAKTHSEYKTFDQEHISIGRAFNNDLIIKDPFVSASHVVLKFVEGSWVCESNKSLNGTFVSSSNEGRAKIKVDGTSPISSGDTIFLGKTSIHVWGIDQPVAPEEALDGGTPLFFDPRKNVPNSLFSFGIFGLAYYLYLSQWMWKNSGSLFQIIAGIAFSLFGLVIWSSIWALITRSTKRQHRFLQHLLFSLQWTVLCLAVSFILRYLFFFVCHDGFDYIVSMGVLGLLSIFIVYGHLTIGTNLSFLKRNMVSSLIAFFIIFLSVLGHYAMHNEFSPDPHHYINIVPVPKKFIPVISINKEIHRLDSIF